MLIEAQFLNKKFYAQDYVKFKIMASKPSKRVHLELDDKIKVLNFHDQGTSARKLASQFNCSKNQINNIVKNKENLLKEYEDFKNRGIKRKRNEKFCDINEAVLQWFRCARTKNIPLSGTLVKEKAIQIAESLGVEDFCASNGWLNKFCNRNTIAFKTLCGESADVNEELCEDWKSRLPIILAGYEDRDVYNLDETGLFFRALPTKSLVEKVEEAKGGKQAKQRLTVCFCVNAAGEKEKPIVIWNAKKPRCFKGNDLSQMGVKYYYNKKAWMTMEIFKEWLISFDNKITNQGRKVILFLDNAPCHFLYENLKSVKLQFLPPSTTSKIQPLDQGVIRCFKLEYRRFVLRRLLSLIDCDKNSSEIIKSITVLDAIRWIRHAWENVKGQTIVNCFKACELSITALEATIDAADLENDVVQLSKAAEIEYDPDSDKYENVVECYDDLSEDWEKRITDELDTGKI